MYLMSTTFCNMRCRHCCWDSTTVKGEVRHMPMEVVRAALQWNHRQEEVGRVGRLNIGGGEPTCHPQFWEVLTWCVEYLRQGGFHRPWMVTNGKRTLDALRLARLAKEGVVSCGLSQDQWHEPVDQLVVAEFEESRHCSGRIINRDGRFVQNIQWDGREPVRAGRCDWGRDECAGNGRPWVMPDGTVRQCGCLDSPAVGDVFKGFRPANDVWGCWKGLDNPNTHGITSLDIWGNRARRAT